MTKTDFSCVKPPILKTDPPGYLTVTVKTMQSAHDFMRRPEPLAGAAGTQTAKRWAPNTT